MARRRVMEHIQKEGSKPEGRPVARSGRACTASAARDHRSGWQSDELDSGTTSPAIEEVDSLRGPDFTNKDVAGCDVDGLGSPMPGNIKTGIGFQIGRVWLCG